MSLILKTDVKYTGVVAARHILEFLNTPTEKTVYLKRMLSDINADSSYITDATSPNVTTKLLAHVKRVQTLGATVLSINYTLKAILFIIENGLLDGDYSAFSADFGAVLGADNIVEKIYGLGGEELDSGGNPKMQVDTSGDYNYIRQQKDSPLGSVIFMSAAHVQSISNGLIVGECSVRDESARILDIRDGPQVNTKLWYGTSTALTTSAGSVTLNVPVTSIGQAGGENFYAPVSRSAVNAGGIVAKYEHGTNRNKLFVNGDLLINDTGSSLAFDASGMTIKAFISGDFQKTGLVEGWLINSKSDSLANSLSIHLNRQ